MLLKSPEKVGPLAGGNAWFQLYPPKEDSLRESLLKRAKDSGFTGLVITADVPAPSRRERTKRAGLRTPPKITPRFIWEGITHPVWSFYTLQAGLPKLRTVASYSDAQDLKSVGEFVRFKFRGALDWDYIKVVRDLWEGPIVLKGILHPRDAEEAIKIGIDGIGVSNHGGRQFDGAPPALEALPDIVKQVDGRASILFDSGLRSGLDIIRALRLGADFVLLGRAFMYGVAALGKLGGDHTAAILIEQIKNNMAQLGISNLSEIQGIEMRKH